MAQETRITQKLMINAEGENGILPATFTLAVRTATEVKSRGTWYQNTPADISKLMTGITRRELAALITDAADWLSYNGQD